MTAHPIDTEALRVRAEHVYRHGGPANAVESLAANIPEILDRLTAAEHRATRAEAQSATRGSAMAIYRERASKAEAQNRAWEQQYAQDIADANRETDEAEADRDRWHSMWRQRGVKHLAAEKRATRAEAERDEWREASVKLAESSNQANADLHEAEAEVKRLSWKCGHLADKYDTDTEELRQEVDQAEARIKAVQDVLDNIDTSNDPALHDGFADIRRALDGDA